MQLKISRFTKNKMVTIELETTAFTLEEMKMLDQLGEPKIEVDKCYGSNPIKFSKRIRTGFKVKARFDASLESDVSVTAGYIDQFLDDVQLQIEEKMYNLSNDFNEELVPSVENRVITY